MHQLHTVLQPHSQAPPECKYVQPGNEATVPPNSHQNVSLPKLLDSWSPTELTFQCDPAFFKLLVTQLLINLQQNILSYRTPQSWEFSPSPSWIGVRVIQTGPPMLMELTLRIQKDQRTSYMYNHIKVPYSKKLLREKTFVNFAVLWLYAKVFSVKLGAWRPQAWQKQAISENRIFH